MTASQKNAKVTSASMVWQKKVSSTFGKNFFFILHVKAKEISAAICVAKIWANWRNCVPLSVQWSDCPWQRMEASFCLGIISAWKELSGSLAGGVTMNMFPDSFFWTDVKPFKGSEVQRVLPWPISHRPVGMVDDLYHFCMHCMKMAEHLVEAVFTALLVFGHTVAPINKSWVSFWESGRFRKLQRPKLFQPALQNDE